MPNKVNFETDIVGRLEWSFFHEGRLQALQYARESGATEWAIERGPGQFFDSASEKLYPEVRIGAELGTELLFVADAAWFARTIEKVSPEFVRAQTAEVQTAQMALNYILTTRGVIEGSPRVFEFIRDNVKFASDIDPESTEFFLVGILIALEFFRRLDATSAK
jgi:hypothetical protein